MSDESWRAWFLRAKSNLTRASIGRQTEEVLYEDLCFDAQQAAEKALKGLMIRLGMDTPRTHSIGYLLQSIEASGKVLVPEGIKEAALLTDFAVTTRYPGDWDPVTESDYRQAVSLAEQVYKWAMSAAESKTLPTQMRRHC